MGSALGSFRVQLVRYVGLAGTYSLEKADEKSATRSAATEACCLQNSVSIAADWLIRLLLTSSY